MALHQLQISHPNLSLEALEQCVSHYDLEYVTYASNYSPRLPSSPPPPPFPHSYANSSPMTSMSSQPPIHVIVNREAYTDKEREVVPLRPDTTIKDFLAWRKNAKATLSLIDDYREDILTRSRGEILFDITLSDQRITTLYRTVWTKLHMATRQLTSKYTDLADIDPPQVHQLWNRLQSIFLPTTLPEKYKLETEFSTLTQGSLSAWEYIQLIRDKSNELRQLGIPIAKEKIMCVINNSLSNETVKSFIYCLQPALTMDECFTSIISYVKHITAITADTPTPLAFMVEHADKTHRRPPYIIRCFYCNEPGHKGFECPHRPPDGTEPTNTPGYYRPPTILPHESQRSDRSPSSHPDRYTSPHTRHNDLPSYNNSNYPRSISQFRPTRPHYEITNHDTHTRDVTSPYSRNASTHHEFSRLDNHGTKRKFTDDISGPESRHSSYHHQRSTTPSHYRPQSPHQRYTSRSDHNHQYHNNRTSSPEGRSSSRPRPDSRDYRSRDRSSHAYPRSRDHSSPYHHRQPPPSIPAPDPPLTTQIRTLLTEFLGAPKSDMPTLPPSTKLAIESNIDQHVCDHVIYTTAADPAPYHQSFMMEVIEVSDTSSDDDAITLTPPPPDVVDLTLHDPINTPSPGLHPVDPPPPFTPPVNDWTWTPCQFRGPNEVWTINQLLQWARNQQITVTTWDSEGLSPETIERMLEHENGYMEQSTTDFDYNPLESSSRPTRHIVRPIREGKRPIQAPVHWNDYERIWRDRHPGLRYYGRPPTFDSTYDGPSISATRQRTILIDRGMQTDAYTGGYKWPRPAPKRGDRTFEEALSSVQALMMTVEEDNPPVLHSSKSQNSFQQRAKQLAQIQINKRMLTAVTSVPSTPELGPTMEYTISFRDILQQDRETGYRTIDFHNDPTAAENYKFQDDCRDQQLKHESTLLHVGEMVIQRHTALAEHALRMKDQYETTYAEYKATSPTFVFRYDTTFHRLPEADLNTGDFQYIIQMARFYFNLHLYLQEAYRIFKRCTYYHRQIRLLQEKEATLRHFLDRRGCGYQVFKAENTYKDVPFATHTEAYVRTHRNQWVQRVHDLQEFTNHWMGTSTREESRAYDSRKQEPDLSSLQYDPAWDLDPYDPFSPDNDESHTQFPNAQDYACEQHLHDYIMSDVPETWDQCPLDTQMLHEQSLRQLPDATNHQPFDETIDLAPPIIPTMEETQIEIRDLIRQAIKQYKQKRSTDHKNRKKIAKRQRESEQDQSHMVVACNALDTDTTKRDQDLIFDSGCTAHMWNHRAHFTSFEPYINSNLKAACANGTVLDIMGKGDIGPLKDVLYVPGLRHCLISGTSLLRQGYSMLIGPVPMVFKTSIPDQVLLRGHFANDLFRISATEFERQLGLRPVTCYVHEISTHHLLQLHQMLGHASATRCSHECKCTKFPGLANLSSRAFHAIQKCEECALAKAKRRSFAGHLDVPTYVGQTWYVDVKGPVATPSLEYGNHYVFGIIDGKSKFLLQYFMKTKDQVLEMFQLFHDEFIPFVRAIQPDLGAITVYSDMGEFHSNAVIDYCQTKGILHRTTCAYSPENNGLIERNWRTITEASIAMLLTANLSEPYWEEARRTAGFIRNRIVGGHPSIDDKSPYQKFFGIRPHIRHFKVFGVYAYPRMPITLSNHQPRADRGIFVGYSDHTMGGYRIYFPLTHTFGHSNHVTFGNSPNRSNESTELAVTDIEDMVTNLHLELMRTPLPSSISLRIPEAPQPPMELPTVANNAPGSPLAYVYYSLQYSLTVCLLEMV